MTIHIKTFNVLALSIMIQHNNSQHNGTFINSIMILCVMTLGKTLGKTLKHFSSVLKFKPLCLEPTC
jgi:hypothetical protein